MRRPRSVRPLAVLTLAALLLAPAVRAQETSASEPFERAQSGMYDLYESTRPGVVGVVVRGPRALISAGGGFGAGLVVDRERRHVLTSSDVAPRGIEQATIRFADHTLASAKVVARNDDVRAVLLEAASLPDSVRALPIGASADVRVGTMVLTLGNPYHSITRVGQTAASLGVVSGIYRAEGHSPYDEPIFELDAAVNPGSFGGPVVDLEGRVLAMVGPTYSHARWLGTAVPIDPIRSWYERVLAGEDLEVEVAKGEPGYLGTVLKRVSGSLTVESFVAGSPGEASGLKVGDVLLAVGNRRLDSLLAWEGYLAAKRPGDVVRISVRRGGKVLHLDVVLGSRFM